MRLRGAKFLFQTIRPKMAILLEYEAAAKAVDDMFASAAQQGVALDAAAHDELEISDGEDDARSRAELQPRLSGDEDIAAEANGGESSETDDVSGIFTLRDG